MTRPLVVLLAFALFVLPAAAAQTDRVSVSGTLLVGGSPSSGFVHLAQYNGSLAVHSTHMQVGPDGRFAFSVPADAETTNLFGNAGGFDSSISLRVRAALDFPWRVDRTAGSDAPVEVTVRDAASGSPVDADLVVVDAVTIGHRCVMQPGETMGATGTAPPVSGSPSSSPSPQQPRDCPLVWDGIGRASGELPEGIYMVDVRDRLWTTCNWEWRQTEDCEPYLPLHASLVVKGSASHWNVSLQKARPADAWVEGYLLSEVKPGPVPNKPIRLSDGDTAVIVVTDQDGSFRIALPSGTYTLSADLCGHHGTAETIALATGATVRQDLTLTGYQTSTGETTLGSFSGTTSEASVETGGGGSSFTGTGNLYPACDHTPTPTMTIAPEPDGSEGDGGQERGTVGQPMASGSLLVVDFGGGLGPFGGRGATTKETAGDLTSASKGSPGPGAVLALLALAAVAVAVRRRL